MLGEVQKMAVAADDVVGQAIRGGGDVDVVSRVGRDDTARHFALDNHRKGAERVNPKIELLLRQTEILSNLRITEATSHFLESSGRNDELKSAVTQETNEESARGPVGPDQPADKNVRVEDGAHGGL